MRRGIVADEHGLINILSTTHDNIMAEPEQIEFEPLGTLQFDADEDCYLSDPIALSILKGHQVTIALEGFDEDESQEDFNVVPCLAR